MCRVFGPLPFGLPESDANHHHFYRSSEDEVSPRGMAVTISSDVSILRPFSSQEAQSETECVTEGWTKTTGATIAERSLEDSRLCAPGETLDCLG
ncbi:hypothetical protein E2C01_099484 [Portunus trituberculatus]|uniref:Uncharacterized protein n=1 Tax=Portunus trituberculatus TaxID=210409 RepID=A0A5B7K9R6_PORTR|nr:hypothetical protein [Portunus trituberculatus]